MSIKSSFCNNDRPVNKRLNDRKRSAAPEDKRSASDPAGSFVHRHVPSRCIGLEEIQAPALLCAFARHHAMHVLQIWIGIVAAMACVLLSTSCCCGLGVVSSFGKSCIRHQSTFLRDPSSSSSAVVNGILSYVRPTFTHQLFTLGVKQG